MRIIKKVTEIISAVLLIAGTAGALLFLMAGEEEGALFALGFAAAVFIFRLRDRNREPVREVRTDRETSYIRYCPFCGYTGSQLPGESVPPCPDCGRLLIATDTTLAEYTVLSVHQRENLKKRWSSFVRER